MQPQAYDPEREAANHRRRVLALSLVGLAVMLAAQALIVRKWTTTDTRPPSWDQSIHMEIAQDYREALAKGDWSTLLHPQPKPGMPAFPPLYHLALQPAMAAADPPRAVYWINFAYFIVLTVCLFGLIMEFMPSYGAAAAAAAFAASPGVQDLLLTQLVDLPVLACSAAAFWAFIRSDEFTEPWPSLAFGALFAVGMLHKWSFFAYMIPAYWVWLHALGRRDSFVLATVSAGIALLGTLPWYLLNWPLMLPRLIQASSDFAVPVWKGGIFLQYFVISLEAFGPALWLMGWIGLAVARFPRRDHLAGLLPFWVLSSYVFWAIVPNRQMRFLMPGLPALAACMVGAFPQPVTWLVFAFNAFLAVNFTAGWIGPLTIPTPFGSAGLFANNPPRREEWAIDDILTAAEKHAYPDEPLANLTLIANHPSFNGPIFTWRSRALGLQRVRIRGVNKRLCEFSQYVLLKTGSLGPDSVIGGLPEAAKIVQAADSWFPKAYVEAARWPLPDGSSAVLYQRARPKKAPYKAGEVRRFLYYQSGGIVADTAVMDVGVWDPARAVYPRARVAAKSLDVRGLKVADVLLHFDDVVLIPSAGSGKDPWDDVRFLRLGRLSVRGLRTDADSLKKFLETRVKGLTLSQLSLDGTIKAAGLFRGVPVNVEISLELLDNPRRLAIRLVSARIGPNPLPVGALNRIKEMTVSLEPNPETPFYIDIPSLTFKNNTLSIP